MLQEIYTLLNFSFIIIYTIHTVSVSLKKSLNSLKDNIFKRFFKEYKTDFYCFRKNNHFFSLRIMMKFSRLKRGKKN